MRDIQIPKDWNRKGLPGWSYHSPALLELEIEEVFKSHWQIVCHVSDVPEAGSFYTFDMCGERAIVVRDQHNKIGVFHNICRHRGSRVVAQENGRCKGALVCPFHGWVYNLDGTLRGAARPDSFPQLDKHEFGLRPIEYEIWNGLIFIRFKKGPQPSVNELLQPFAEEIAPYNFENRVPVSEMWSQSIPVNWKSVRDVDNEGYHVAMAHPALQDLYGNNYMDEPYVDGVSRSYAEFNNSGGKRWAVRNYTKLSKPNDGLPEHLHRAWIYYGLFPNAVLAVTPETVLFYQEFPTSTGQSLLRGNTYRYKTEDRQQRAARYLASRIDRETVEEDIQLTIWSNESMASKSFEGFYLSDLEYGVRTHHDHLRKILPIYNVEMQPDESEITELNASLAGKS